MKSSVETDKILEILQESLSPLLENQKLIVAYSGGLDSHVLLHALSRLRHHGLKQSILAVHIDHGLQDESAQWAQHCEAVAYELHIPIKCQQVVVDQQKGLSLEAAARAARYLALASYLSEQDVLLTAHHENDQAETLMLQLLRGAGPKGLAAMPLKKSFSRGWHVRPLLFVSKQGFLQYARQNKLEWIEDPSNQLDKFDRNFWRNKVNPVIQQRWPSQAKTLCRAARLQAETVGLLDEVAAEDLARVENNQLGTLVIEKLKGLSEARMKNCLRYWIKQSGLPAPSEIKLNTLCGQMLTAKQDAQPSVTWGGGEIRRYQGELYAMEPLAEFDHKQVVAWADTSKPLLIAGLKTSLSINLLKAEGLWIAKDRPISIRFRQGGEVIKPAGRGIQKDLKKLFQEWGVPPWERARVPLIYFGEELVAVYKFTIADDFYCTA